MVRRNWVRTGERSLASGVPDEQKTALVTGATAGIGYHTAAGLARAGYRVVITGRDERRGRVAADEIGRLAGTCRVHFVAADASTVGMSQALARLVRAEFGRLDVLVNHVGGQPHARRVETADGYEATLAVHFVAGVALTTALLPLLRDCAPARVVNVVSSAFSQSKRDPFEDLHSVDRYVPLEAYARAKLLALLWTLALARELDGTGVVVNAVDPGMAWTAVTQAPKPEIVPIRRLVRPVVRWFQGRASPMKAARAPLRLAVAPEVDGITASYFDGFRVRDLPARLRDPGLIERVRELGNALVAGAPTAVG